MICRIAKIKVEVIKRHNTKLRLCKHTAPLLNMLKSILSNMLIQS